MTSKFENRLNKGKRTCIHIEHYIFKLIYLIISFKNK